MKEKLVSFLKRGKDWFRRRRRLVIILGGGGGFLVIFFLFFLFLPSRGVYRQLKALEERKSKITLALEEKNLPKIKEELEESRKIVEKMEKSWRWLGWARFVPGIRGYYLDGERGFRAAKEAIAAAKVVVEAVSPYADFFGLQTGEVKTSEKTTQERIEFLTESIAGLRPKLGEIKSHLEKIEKEIASLDPNRYPEEIRGIRVREKLTQGKELFFQLSEVVKKGEPLLARADWLLGKEEPRFYLFLFQNDGELRPTGGFWTAYGILKVEKGEVSPLRSEDIYALDARFDSTIPAPRPIKEYHKNVYYWYLRDMNLSPDFKVSVEEFLSHYQQIPGVLPVDGVIAVDTQVLVDLLRVLGPIGVPGWGNFKADEDERCFGCPQVVYQLELLADKPVATQKKNRKGFLAPLLHSLIANILASPKERLAPLANTLWQNAQNKHVLFYFPDKELQEAVEGIGFAGRIKDFTGDYFHFNDCNFAGAKSNLFITQEVKHEYQVEGEEIKKKVTITYKNSAPPSNCNLEQGGLCLNGLYRDWFRLFVPQGSELEKLIGSEREAVVYSELGKSVFEGFFGDKYPLRPEGVARVVYHYRLPFKKEKGLRLLIQKQPGKKQVKHEIWVNGRKVKEVMVESDTVVSLDL